MLDFLIFSFHAFQIQAFYLNRVSHLAGHLIILIFGRLTSTSIAGYFPDSHLGTILFKYRTSEKASVLLRVQLLGSNASGPRDEIQVKMLPLLRAAMPFYDFLVSHGWNDLFLHLAIAMHPIALSPNAFSSNRIRFSDLCFSCYIVYNILTINQLLCM